MSFILPGGIGQLFAPPLIISVWDSAHSWAYSGGTYALSNGNRTITQTGSGSSQVSIIRGLKSNNSGLHYFEMTVNPFSNNVYTTGGVVNSSFNGATAVVVGNDTNGWGLFSSGGLWQPMYNGAPGTSGTVSPAAGDTFGFHINFTSGWMFFSVNGTYLTGVPSGSANATFTFTAGTLLFPGCSVDNSVTTSAMTLNTVAPFNYTPYTGYSAWG